MTKNLTAGPPVRLILLFTLPLLIGNLFQQAYSFTDTARWAACSESMRWPRSGHLEASSSS